MFSALSRHVTFEGPVEQTAHVLQAILQGVIVELGGELVGHAKVIARTPLGVFYASTTGDRAPVHVNADGQPDPSVSTVAIDFNCVFHGLKRRRLATAWEHTAETLRQRGYRLVETPVLPSARVRGRGSRVNVGLGASMAASLVALKPCCVLPVLASVSGGGLGVLQFLQPLEPYRPYFLILTLMLLAIAFHRIYVRPQDETSDELEASVRRTKTVFLLSAVLFLGAVALPPLLPAQTHEHAPNGQHSHG